MNPTANRTYRRAGIIGSALFLIYCLTFSGQFTSIDELNLYAMTESVVQTGTFDVPQIAFAEFHNQVGNHEPTFSMFAASLYGLANRLPALNNIITTMLLNVLLVSLTGALLFLIATKLGYSAGAGTAAALAFGLGSLAWPYALSFYRGTLVALLWTAALWTMLHWRDAHPFRAAAAGGLLILLSLLTKINVTFSAPLLLLVLVQHRPRRRALLGLLGVGLLLSLLFSQLYLWRIGQAWEWNRLLALDVGQIASRVYGQLLSPGKGLIFYMPVILFTVPGFWQLWRRHPAPALALLLNFGSLVVVTSTYSSWYGGQSWGPRLLLPALAPLLLTIAPVWDTLTHRWQQAAFGSVLASSVLVQAAAVSNDWWKGYQALFALGPIPEDGPGLLLRNILLSPPIELLRTWRFADLDLLWIHTGADGAWHTQLSIAGALLLCLLLLVWQRRRGSRLYLLLPLAGAMLVAVGGGRVSSGYPGMPNETARAIAEWVRPPGGQPYSIVTMSNEFHIYFYTGYLSGNYVHHWYSPNQTTGFEPLLDNLKGETVSFVADRVHIDPEYSGKELEWWLNTHLYRYESQWIGDYKLIRYARLFEDKSITTPVALQIGSAYALNAVTMVQESVAPGSVVGVQLRSVAWVRRRRWRTFSCIFFPSRARLWGWTGRWATESC